jgi:hypothetical protein
VQNPCVYNKLVNNVQITIIIHVDDLMITRIHKHLIDQVTDMLTRAYKDIRAVCAEIIGYLIGNEARILVLCANPPNDRIKLSKQRRSNVTNDILVTQKDQGASYLAR